MKILNIVGSPHIQGNGAAVASALLGILTNHGASAQTHELNTLQYRGCQGCYACKTTSEVCVVKDDVSPILEGIQAADVVVVSVPIYMCELNAQVKGLFDRCYSFMAPDFRTNPNASRLAAGKKFVFIVTQGNPDEKNFADIIPRYTRMLGMVGFKKIYPLRVCGAGQGKEIRISDTVMNSVHETAQRVLSE